MKLVIDIPEEDYKSACKREFSMDGSMMIYNAIKEGTEYKEQPHGEWIKSPVGSYCSNCKSTVPFNPLGKEYFSPFCMECGADMRKRGDLE